MNEYVSKAQKHNSSANEDIKNANEVYNEMIKKQLNRDCYGI